MTLTRILAVPLWTGCLLLGSPAVSAAENLLKNGDFANSGGPAGASNWILQQGQESSPVIDAADKPTGASRSLHVEIKGGSDGVIYQKVALKPQTNYVFSGWIKGTEAHLGSLSLKYFKDGEDGLRLSTEQCTGEWKEVSKSFNSGSADKAILMLRFDHQKGVGKSMWFADVRLSEQPAP